MKIFGFDPPWVFAGYVVLSILVALVDFFINWRLTRENWMRSIGIIAITFLIWPFRALQSAREWLTNRGYF